MPEEPLKESVDIYHAMQNPDNLNAAANRHIKNQVLADWKTLQTGIEFIPVSTHIREPSELPACFLNFVKEFVRVPGHCDHRIRRKVITESGR